MSNWTNMGIPDRDDGSICVGEAMRTPMLRGDDLAWLRLELGTDFAAPRALADRFSFG